MTDSLRVFLAGDSTMQAYTAKEAPQAGWGQMIENYFYENVTFFNHAIGGRSSRTFIEEGRLDQILEEITEGDYLFIQMGHNDATNFRPARYTEPYGNYKTYLNQYISGARSKGATPILLTPVGRLHYVNHEFLVDFGDYCNAMKELAAEENVLLIDLMKKSIECYTSIGYQAAAKLFMISEDGTDCTHFTEEGADQIAALVAEGVTELEIDLKKFIKSVV